MDILRDFFALLDVRVWAGLILFCLTASVILYLLPRSRKLSRKKVEVMAKIPADNALLISCLIVLGVNWLLINLGYQKPVTWLNRALVGVVFTLFVPAMFGSFAADQVVLKQKLAETEKRRQEEDEARREELARLLKS